MHFQVQFSATVPAKMVNLIQVVYIQTHCICNPHTHTCILINITVVVESENFNLNFCLKFKGGKSLSSGGSALCPPLNKALVGSENEA